MSVTIDGTSGVTTPALTAGGTPFPVEGGFGFRNRIINGDMRIDQRNNGASTTSAQGYTLDRFAVNSGGGGLFNVQRDTVAPAGFSNSLRITVGTADSSLAASDYGQLYQVVEGFNFADMAWGTASAQTVTLSFWVRASVTGTYAGGLVNSAENRSYVFTYTISAANTWEYKTITIAGDTAGTWVTNNGKGVNVKWDLGSGSNYQNTAGSWVASHSFSTSGSVKLSATAGATFYITGVQLEAGSVATPFERRPYGVEFLLCQRYYQLTGAYFAATQTGNELNCVGSCNVKVDMRANPTATLPAGSRFHRPGVAFYAASAVDVGPTATGQDYQNVTIAAGAGAGTVGQIDKGLILSAEL